MYKKIHQTETPSPQPLRLVKTRQIVRFVVIIIAILFSISLLRNIAILRSADSKLEVARAKLDKLISENQILKKEAEQVGSDFFKEKQGRDKLGLAKEGEIVVVLPPEDTLKKIAPRWDNQEDHTLPDPNWKKWLNLFVY